MSKTYAGIGSRKTPPHVLGLMTFAAALLERNDYILRSGGAPGADRAFEKGVQDPVHKEIFLPWKRFNDNDSSLFTPRSEAYLIAEQYHPSWSTLRPAAKRLMARNSHQVLGLNLDDPVEFLLCWTDKGKQVGGTAQAMRIAQDRGIRICNLFFDENKELLSLWVEEGRVFFPG